MRKMFLTAVALAPLYLAASAQAETVITNDRTTPISTATANNGAPDSIRIDDNGAIELNSGAAVTVNSNNNVINDGAITMDDAADNTTGIVIADGVTADVTNNGSISLSDDYTPDDDDDDGDLDGAFATGTDRKGIWAQGDMTGDIVIGDEGSISIDGNDSYGILVEGTLTGDLTSSGLIRVAGDDGYGIRLMDTVNGDVAVGGQVSVQGENSMAVAIEGAVNGAVVISGTVSSTGYRYGQRPTDEFIEGLEADDLLQGGPAVWVSNDVTAGVLFARTPLDLDEEDDDENDNGIPDDEETTAQVTSIGGAPAVRIGSTTENITLGAVGAGDDAYGFIARGNITAGGLYDDIAATAIELGMVGGLDVDIFGGVRLEDGMVTAVAFDAEALGIVFRDGVTTPMLYMDNSMSATLLGDEDHDAIVVLIEAGAVVPEIYNLGDMGATVAGETGGAYGIVDRSGGVNLVQNAGTIVASVIATDDEDDLDDDNLDPSDEIINSPTVAIDLSVNTLGAVVRQLGLTDGDDLDDGVADNDADGDGVDDEDEPAIVGDIRFGSGADLLDIQNGTVQGDVIFGDGVDNMVIDGGASFLGRIDDSDNSLILAVTDGSLEATNTAPVQIGQLTVATDGVLVLTLDPQAGVGSEISGFDVTGTATLADGAELGVRFNSLLQVGSSFTVIQAGDLVVGNLDLTTLSDNTPFAYNAAAVVDTVNDVLLLQVTRKSAADMGMIASEAAAYDAIYGALNGNDALRYEFLRRLSQKEFFELYSQLIPHHSGGPLLSLTAGIDAVRQALADRRVQGNPGEVTAWAQQLNFYTDKETLGAYGFNSEGAGFASGLERGGRMGTWGLSFAFATSDMKDETALLEEVLTAQLFELGAYWRTGGDNWRYWARGAAGWALFDEKREVITPSILMRFDSHWNGYSLAAGTGGSYDVNFGKWYGRAEGAVEYFYLTEEEHGERGSDPDLRYHFDARTGHLFKGEVTFNVGRRFGQDGWFTPEFRIGWRQNFSSDLGVTTFRIGGGALRSTLLPDSIEGGGPLLGFRMTAGSSMGFLGFEGTAILLDEYEFYSLMLRAGYRF